MPIRVFWAEPGPKADDALRRYWARAYEIAAEIVKRQALAELHSQAEEDANKAKEPGQ